MVHGMFFIDTLRTFGNTPIDIVDAMESFSPLENNV